MTLKKVFVASALALSLVGLPTIPSYGANEIEVFAQNLASDTDTINIFYNNARGGYLYQLYLGNNTNRMLTSGTFSDDSGQISLKKSAYPDLANARNGEKLTLRVVEPQNLRIISEKSVTLQATPKVPTHMRVLNANLISDKQNQNLDLAFDQNYVPGSRDRVNFYPLDSSGNIIQTGQRQVFEIYKGDLTQRGNDQVATLNISVPREVKAYKIVFTSGSQEISSLTQKLTIGEAIKEVKRLVIDFPSTAVGLGDNIKVRVLAEDSYGNRNDISRQADLTFYGNALRTRDYFNQAFTVYDNSRYLGDSIRIVARYKGISQEQSVKVIKDRVYDTNNSATTSNQRYTLDFKTTDLHTGKNYIQFQIRDDKGQAKALPFSPTDVLISLVDTGSTRPIAVSATVFESSKLTSTGEGTLELNVSEAINGRIVAIFRGQNPSQIYSVNSQPLRITGNSTTLPSLPNLNTSTNGSKSVILFMNAQSLIVDGTQKTTNNLPSIISGRTYVPLRTVAEAFGAKVTWNQGSKTATAVLGDTTVNMIIGQKNYTKNNIPHTMDAASYIDKKTNSTMVPVRYMAEAFGYKLDYNKIQINFTK